MQSLQVRKILIKKMQHYGFRGAAKKHFVLSLENWHQYISLNNTHFNTKLINCGIYQGTVLCLFFLHCTSLTLAIVHLGFLDFLRITLTLFYNIKTEYQ